MHRKTIMVADDDQDILDLLTVLLIDSGYHVRTAFNGDNLERLVADPPDLLLLDIWMSGGRNGRDICHNLKTDPATKNIPIILISANHDIAEAAQESGANGYVPKPFNTKHLLQVIKQQLEEGN